MPKLNDIVSIVFLSMVFMHIVDDYYLQGCLANMKQKKWWEPYVKENEIYKYDYVVALFMHGFSWSFMIHIPLIVIYFIYGYSNLIYLISVSILINTIFHTAIDHLKCNKFKINLQEDQILHLIQILVTFFVYIILPIYN